ncbi:MAG TPA: glycosyltransferase [Fibrobacteria bacterium]|nr:glycosyltransferase [Fibrobacteria bacterium]
MKRRVWILTGRALGKGLLGPAVRLKAMAEAAAMEGHEVHAVVEAPESNPLPSTVRLHDLRGFDLGEIRPGDGLVLSPYLSAPTAWKILRSDLPFHLDLYCVTATEQMPLWARSPGKARDTERAKLRRRYLLHAMRAETIYVSCIEQWLVVAGMFLSERDWRRGGLADSLTRKVREVPMGVSEAPFPTGSPNPYPAALQGRPVFLWGGSLWNWFDLPCLVEAFRILQERGSDATLFFLSGGNRTERASEDDPVRWVREQAERLGILGKNVFFNDVSVAPDALAPWLEHCTAGILTNPASLESLSSWRTRVLDLLWAGKPLVASGRDPLGDRMHRAGASLTTTAGDAESLADSIRALATDPARCQAMGESARRLAPDLSWSRNLSPLLEALRTPASFRDRGIRPGWMDALRYFAG